MKAFLKTLLIQWSVFLLVTALLVAFVVVVAIPIGAHWIDIIGTYWQGYTFP